MQNKKKMAARRTEAQLLRFRRAHEKKPRFRMAHENIHPIPGRPISS